MRKTICVINWPIPCLRPVKALGLCSMHYQRQKRTGDPLGTIDKRPTDIPFDDWFLSMCKPVDGCLVWQGKTDRAGYGQQISVPWAKPIAPHIVSWVLSFGPVPKGLSVCHTCDNPPCILPDHLWLGTPAENTADMIAKGRDRKPFGERHHKAVLTDDRVRDIRKRRSDGETLRQLAADFGVSESTISSICSRQTWKHVD